MKALNETPKSCEYLVYGYIRRFTEIPSPIIDICILYHSIGDYFKIAGKNISISGVNRNIITKKKATDWFNMSYGSLWINSMTKYIVRWTFKIQNIGYQYDVRYNDKIFNDIDIGIITKDTTIDSSCWKNHNIGYFWSMHQRNIIHKGLTIQEQYGKLKYIAKGNIITMQLDLKKNKLIYYINDKSLGNINTKIQTGPSIQYKMAVTLAKKNCKLTLENFECLL